MVADSTLLKSRHAKTLTSSVINQIGSNTITATLVERGNHWETQMYTETLCNIPLMSPQGLEMCVFEFTVGLLYFFFFFFFLSLC